MPSSSPGRLFPLVAALLLAACSSAGSAGRPQTGGEGGDESGGAAGGERGGGTGGATPSGGAGGGGGSAGASGAAGSAGAGAGGSAGASGAGGTNRPDAASTLEKDAGPGTPDGGTADGLPGTEAGGGGGSGMGEALLLTGQVPLIGSDIQIHEELVARGFKVTDAVDAMTTPEMATGKKIVVISYGVDSKNVSPKFADVPASVIMLEHNLLPAFGMTAPDGHGYQLPGTQISIVKSDSPLAAGFTGDVTVIMNNGEVFWGIPSDSALKIATVKGNANHWTYFAYEAGAMMVGRKAPGKRVHFFLGAHLVPTKFLNPAGLKLLDATIDWCGK